MVNYAFKDEEGTAKAAGLNLPISTKASLEVCNTIRGNKLEQAKNLLERVLVKKTAIKYNRFTNGAGHKAGIGSGKYPIKTVTHILKLLKVAETNAAEKGLDEILIIKKLVVQKASRPWRYGRKRRRKAKRTNIQIQLAELEEKKKIKTTELKKSKPVEKEESEKTKKKTEDTKNQVKKETKTEKKTKKAK